MGAVRFRGVGLVAENGVRAGSRPSRADPRYRQCLHQDREHRRVTGLTWPDQQDQRSAVPVGELVDLRAEPAPRPPEPVVSRLEEKVRIIRQIPLCHARGWCRAGGPDRSSSPPTRSSRPTRSRRRVSAGPRGSCPRSRRRLNGGAVSRSSATERNPRERPATQSRSGSGRRCPPRPADDPGTGAPDIRRRKEATARSTTTAHRSGIQCATR